ncbi:TIGR02391 family protein [Sedimentibacter sp. zth1]|uniref:TIGR02391 family protein n=1 Tax=Sedimentibacter sp. zth1 TaxID=2816908 RepID=UPI001A916804|nr:TIGR02391 family protein [Sedimentibacter sp. zth1]QSX07244.1 TIGR02391 family protein [Sedimentibacter sp. zth1]
MNIDTDLGIDLKEAIEKNYYNESYSSAILDSMHVLTEIIRNKTGLEGDGVTLVGQAFGGDNPRIKINKLQTDSEKNEQKGIQDIIRGLYIAIRNPRSHDKYNDSKKVADTIIFFIDYLLKLIDKSKLSFEEKDFLKKVYDKHFVKSKEYCDLLVKEIPKRQRINIAISIVLDRDKGDIYNLSWFMHSLQENLEEDEIDRLYKVISQELIYASSHIEISTILKIFDPKYWYKVDKVARLRIENLLYEDIKNGKYNKEDNCCIEGALATWIDNEHFNHFSDTEKWSRLLVEKLESDEAMEKEYVKEYFWDSLVHINRNELYYSLKEYIRKGLKSKDEFVITNVEIEICYDYSHPWWQIFEEELKNYTNIEYIDITF